MASHLSINTNFKVGPLRGLRGSINSVFKDSFITQDIGTLLQFIFEQLVESHYPMLLREMFTLVGIQNNLTNQSVGYTKPLEDESIVPTMTELTLVFSMARIPKKTIKNPHVIRGTENCRFLGTLDKRASYTDYMVMGIRTKELSMDLDYNYQSDLVYLYNIIGAVTKNFVRNNAWWKKDSAFPLAIYKDLTLVESMYANKNIKDVIDSVPYNMWGYNREVWREANNLLCDHHFSERFCLYYVLYIHEFVPESLAPPAEDFIYSPKSILNSFIEKGLRHFSAHIKSGTRSATPNIVGVLRLLYFVAERETLGTEYELEQDFIELVESLSKEHYAERKQMLLTTLSATQTLASSLITGESDNVLSRVLENLI